MKGLRLGGDGETDGFVKAVTCESSLNFIRPESRPLNKAQLKVTSKANISRTCA